MSHPRPRPTHEKVTGTNRGEIIGWMSQFPEEIPGQLKAGLSRLGKDGGFNDVYVYYMIYPIPPGAKQGEKVNPPEWIEAAGTAERLTVEVKQRDADGVCRLYTVGRPSAAEETEASEVLRFTFKQAHVRPSEVLTTTDAIGLFQHYYDHHAIPEGWHLRETQGAVPIPRPEDAPAVAPSPTASTPSAAVPAAGAVAGQAANTAPGKHAQPDEQAEQQRRSDNA